ncbi:hypothetical protein K4F52_000365 [Lecanicillium sp. MT-2017a]|nr:hypothetical protein K4F52_000365 [Lecanicillium sp. MT-2017a]
MRLLPLLALVPLSCAAIARSSVSLLKAVADLTDELQNDKASDESFWVEWARVQGRSICFVLPKGDGEDDAPNIMDALNRQCRKNSLVVFPGPTYTIKTNMTTTDMDDVRIHQFGRFVWSTDIDYWLSVSMPIGFQNQSTVWYFGGDKITWDGHGVGTLDGNGQAWYDYAKGRSNLAHRPMMINWRKMSNSVVRRMRFVQSQMWTMVTTYSKNLEFTDIYVNNTSASKWNTLNTDGIDTIYSDGITLRQWDITCGDDAIALKPNSSNIAAYDIIIRGGTGIAIGSMGQYKDRYDYITNFYAHNITMYSPIHALYFKTWAGVSHGYPPNGGGGGLGIANNIEIDGVKLEGCRSNPLHAWQCENYEGNQGKDCQTSKFKMSNFTAKDIKGWTNEEVIHAGWFQCSAAAGGCDNFSVEGFQVSRGKNGKPSDKWHCENMHGNHGFTCTD